MAWNPSLCCETVFFRFPPFSLLKKLPVFDIEFSKWYIIYNMIVRQ
jgi:hypothetical protein